MRIFLAFAVGVIIALIVTPLTKKLAVALNLYDTPDARKVHTGQMTRLGGLGIYAGFLGGFLVYGDFSMLMIGLLISSTIICAVGFIDDVKNLPPKVKLLGQIVGAVVFMVFGAKISYVTNPVSGELFYLGFMSYPLTLLWLLAVCNAINLIDGLDGLASGVSGIASLTLAVVAFAKGFDLIGAMSLILLGGTLGFLKSNFNPAKLFMGDCGALFLGFVLGALSLMGLSEGATVVSICIPVMILGVPILDTCFAIVRRSLNHKPIFQADKDHLHHRLLARGLSHRDAVLVIYAFTFILGASAIFLTLLPSFISLVVLAVLFISIIIGANKLGIFGERQKKRDLPQ